MSQTEENPADQPQSPSPDEASAPTVEEIARNVGTTGEAFDTAVAAAVAVLTQLNAALEPYRGQLPQQLRSVVDAIALMQGAGTKQ